MTTIMSTTINDTIITTLLATTIPYTAYDYYDYYDYYNYCTMIVTVVCTILILILLLFIIIYMNWYYIRRKFCKCKYYIVSKFSYKGYRFNELHENDFTDSTIIEF
ncbi:hypothetical protein [Cetacean poxvirus 1]|nr:hypothetical protein [Cetacean poxvirus 1]